MIGKFIVLDFVNDALVTAKSEMNDGIEGRFYLPPLMRRATSEIGEGSAFFGVLDDASGYGAAIVGFDNADFGGVFRYDIHSTGTIVADNDVKSGAISLTGHIHSAAIMAADPAESFKVTGTTTAAQAGV